MTNKERITRKILDAFREAEEHGFTIAVASDDEGNGFNRLTSRRDYGIYESKPTAIVLGVFGRVDEEDVFDVIDEE